VLRERERVTDALRLKQIERGNDDGPCVKLKKKAVEETLWGVFFLACGRGFGYK
jgi:hypothetical protein